MNTMPLFVPAALLLAACTPTATDATGAPMTATAKANPAAASPPSPPPAPSASTASPSEQAPKPATEAPAAEPASASISGAIRDGNRAPPALRVCATPVDGGAATCIDTVEGTRMYRVEVAPGRYYLLGWARSGELALIAHASQIRCIRAPCPPDELIEVAVAAGEHREGVDLNGGYAAVPDGWPTRRD